MGVGVKVVYVVGLVVRALTLICRSPKLCVVWRSGSRRLRSFGVPCFRTASAGFGVQVGIQRLREGLKEAVKIEHFVEVVAAVVVVVFCAIAVVVVVLVAAAEGAAAPAMTPVAEKLVQRRGSGARFSI